MKSRRCPYCAFVTQAGWARMQQHLIWHEILKADPDEGERLREQMT